MPAGSMPASIPATWRMRTSARPRSTTSRRSAFAPSCGRWSGRRSSRATRDKKYKNIIQGASGAFGNAATRLQEFVVKGGNYAYGSYPEIDELFPQQAVELDRTKRAAILAKMQRLLDERTMYVSIWQLAFISGVGPRVDAVRASG